MKQFLLVVAGAFFMMIAPSCSKDKMQQKVEDLVVQVMIDGVWKVTKYEEGTDDQTALFTDWESQFFENRTCKAKNIVTNVEVPGTWEGSYATQTMTGNFNNHPPINKLNGTWKIIRSNYTVGEFSRELNGVVYKLSIQKK
ncbi:hypothetical protein [Aridibaculum aurantiacum]|uniref:hypothetical protein n=1 Tax=Aridibaculum aurantiacum TaxID=2810307 RepID=UPI001A95DE53|nr:hypothetical protein [Aridibaculum aurantiacum]